MQNSKAQLEVLGISFSHTMSGAYALILEEVGGNRRIPVVIGDFEAQAIANQIEKIQRQHPLTHDLFIDLAELFNIKLTEVNIYKLERGVFYARITCVAEDGTEKLLEARTSDAVALALQFGCPIYTTQQILDESGVVVDQEEGEGAYESFAGVLDLSKKDIEELRQMLEDAIAAEDYEYASKIRDEIKVRS